jgi:hypothetical protein
MRKWMWWACLVVVLGAADLIGSAYYVYKNPDSFLGRCATTSFVLATRYNPFLYGYQSVSADVAKVMANQFETTAQDQEETERPDDPTPVEEAEVVGQAPVVSLDELLGRPMPQPQVADQDDENAGRWVEEAPAATAEPPLADGQESLSQPIVDPALMPVSGVAVGGVVVAMPSSCSEGGFMGWFQRNYQDCLAAAKALSDRQWLYYWFGFLSTPSTLQNQGDAETSEPMDQSQSDEYQEDPNRDYHHNDCPYTGFCPYTGRMPSYAPPVEQIDDVEKKVEPKKPMKKMKPPKLDDSEQSETTPIHPEVDTMEFRDSDRTWDDYGDDPFKL